jgi:hypothetical protein
MYMFIFLQPKRKMMIKFTLSSPEKTPSPGEQHKHSLNIFTKSRSFIYIRM